MGRHEIDRLGRRHLRRNDQIALVFAILVIYENENPPVAGVFEDFLDRRYGIMPVFFHRSGLLKGHAHATPSVLCAGNSSRSANMPEGHRF